MPREGVSSRSTSEDSFEAVEGVFWRLSVVSIYESRVVSKKFDVPVGSMRDPRVDDGLKAVSAVRTCGVWPFSLEDLRLGAITAALETQTAVFQELPREEHPVCLFVQLVCLLD